MLSHFCDPTVFLLSIWYQCKPFVNGLSPSGRYLNCFRPDPGQWLYVVNFTLFVGITDCFTLPTQILKGFEMILSDIKTETYPDIQEEWSNV